MNVHLPHDWLPLQHEAEQAAREHFNMLAEEIMHQREDGVYPRWKDAKPEGRQNAIGAQVRLLADLMRPESRDFWVRWLRRERGIRTLQAVPSYENDRRQEAIDADLYFLREEPEALRNALLKEHP
jgi:hemerythrin superfamily protein